MTSHGLIWLGPRGSPPEHREVRKIEHAAADAGPRLPPGPSEFSTG